MKRKPLKYYLASFLGIIVYLASFTPAMATEHAVAGFIYDITGIDIAPVTDGASSDNQNVSAMSLDSTPIPGFNNIGIANVETNLLIRKEPNSNATILGKMPRHSGCEILEPDNNGWTKVKSGKVTGYVKSEYLITGPEASKLALEIAIHVATFNGEGRLRVRKDPSISDDNIIDFIAPGEEILVLDPLVVTYGEEINKWVKVSLDGDDSEEGTVGYVAKEYVDLSYKLAQAYTIEELTYGTGVSNKRANIVNYAKKFLGYRYVWGGSGINNLKKNKGVDCSGFVQAVFGEFGYSLPRTSRDQAKYSRGTTISTSQLKPGDLIFYGSKSYINHVAIYIGNNKIIHASNRKDGIKISNAFYRTPVKCVRIIND